MMEERAVKEDNNKVDIKQKKAVPRAELRRYAAEIVRKEAQALLDLAARLDPIDDPVSEKYGPRLLPGHEQDDFSRAVDLLKHMNSHGRIIMTGVGKSGLLARKAVATFNSFGKSRQAI
jgi:D-arabinose 5-phosphate isomerase GutQ